MRAGSPVVAPNDNSAEFDSRAGLVIAALVIIVCCVLCATTALLIARRRGRVEHVDLPLPDFTFVTHTGLDLQPEHGDCVWVPVTFLRRLIAPPEAARILRLERERVAECAIGVEQDGIQEPLTIVLDDDSVCLRDGHHRTLSEALTHFPVRIEYSERIRKHKLPQRELIELLWNARRGKRV